MFLAAFSEIRLLGIMGELRKEGVELSSGAPENVPDSVFVNILNRIRGKLKNIKDEDLVKHLGLLLNRLGTVKS